MANSGIRRRFVGMSANTFLLALASLFADISTEMLYPVLPVFLTQTLKASGSIVGFVDGFAQATQNIVQGFSGAPSAMALVASERGAPRWLRFAASFSAGPLSASAWDRSPSRRARRAPLLEGSNLVAPRSRATALV